jgi:3-dehydroquinate synthase
MEAIQQIVRAEFRYGVHFTRGVFEPRNTILRNVIAGAGAAPRRTMFVVEDGVCRNESRLLQQIGAYCHAHAAVIDSVTAPIVVPGGEVVKNSNLYVDLLREMVNTHRICRHSMVIAIGGGALLDMAGFAAATSHRGVRLIRLPTTVLAQNDSGVGVKNSLNLFGKKNFIGTFTPPFAVINDFDFLDSLPDREWRSGVAEAVKVGLIKDASFFEYIESVASALASRDRGVMERVIYRCAELHLQHIAGSDPFETGSSRPLDFGHWAAHKLEQLTNHRLRHGEAVSVGIALDTTYSHLRGMLSKQEWLRVMNVLMELDLPLYVPELEAGDEFESGSLLSGLSEFREHLGGELTIMLLEGIGRGIEVHEMDRDTIRRSVASLRHLHRALPVDCAV